MQNCVFIQCSCKGWWLSADSSYRMAAGMVNHWQLSAFSQDEYKILSSPILLFFSYALSGFASLQKLEEESPPDKLVGNKESTSSK
jgi:hypothetical protein